MPAKNLVLVVVGHQGYIRHTDDQKDYGPQNDFLFTAISGTYLPLLNLFKRLESDSVPFKLSLVLSAPLCTLLDDPVIQLQYIEWLDRRIALGQKELRRCDGNDDLTAAANACLVQARKDKIDFTEVYEQKLLPRFAEYARKGCIELLATAGTYAFLPHYADMPEILNGQVETGLYAHRHFFGTVPEGFWLPYMGYVPGVENVLRSYGLAYTILDTHGFLFSEHAPAGGIFAPARSSNMLALFARDGEIPSAMTIEKGFMSHPAYRAQSRDIGFELSAADLGVFLPAGYARVTTGYRYWANGSGKDGENPVYDEKKAYAQASSDAAVFLQSKKEKLEKAAAALPDKPVSLVCTLPASLLGQDWAEGVVWLEQVFRQNPGTGITLAHCSRILDGEYDLPKLEPFPSAASGTGYGEDLLDSTNGWMLRYVRKMSARMVDLAGRFPDDTGLKARLLNLGARELLLAQSGEWPKMLHDGTMPEYVSECFKKSILAFTTVFDSLGSNTVSTEWLTKLEMAHPLFPWMNYRIFARKK
jgi:1,4-alpha-glucan branching enzyme